MNKDLLVLAKYRNKHKMYLKKYQKGGTYPVYVEFSRLEVSEINTEDTTENNKFIKLVNDAIEMQRYYYKYFDLYGLIHEKGIDSSKGLPEEEIKKMDTRNIGIDSYESTLIIDKLNLLNDYLKAYNIETIQSQISYYINECSFSPPYFQLPFIEFSGVIKSIPVLKMIVDHKLLENYYSTSFSDQPNSVRIAITRPYLNDEGQLIQEFDDKKFWQDVCDAVEEVTKGILNNAEMKKSYVEFNVNENDKDLDKNKKWYILNPDGYIEIIQNKRKLNPYFNKIPLTTLNVRYYPRYDLFKKKLVKIN